MSRSPQPKPATTDGGALSQSARAEQNGVSLGASGAITGSGAIRTGDSDGDQLTVSLDQLLGAEFASVLADIRLELDAVSPALAGLTARVNSALGPVGAELEALTGPNGQLTTLVSNLVERLNPALGAVGVSASVNASIAADLQAAVSPILTGRYGNGAASFDLQTGEVAIDLEALHGGSLNDKPVGYELLSTSGIDQECGPERDDAPGADCRRDMCRSGCWR